MGEWLDERTGDVWTWNEAELIVDVTDNPVVHELLGPDGEVIRQWRERPSVGFR